MKTLGRWAVVLMGAAALALNVLVLAAVLIKDIRTGRLTWDPLVGWTTIVISVGCFLLAPGLSWWLARRKEALRRAASVRS